MAPPVDESLRIYRNLVWGNLAKFHVLDSRQYRSDQPCGSSNDFGAPCPERLDPTHTLLGDEQEQWLGRSLTHSPATWDVLANQVVMTSMPVAGLLSFDQWDGYPAARTRLFDSLAAAGTVNPVVITGDIHASGVGDVVDEAPGSPAAATEFVGTSISSGFFTDAVAVAEQLIGALPYVRWVNARKRGYVRCDVTPETLVAQYRLVDTVATPTSPISTERTFTVEAGTIGAHE
jgi:alkaline phosphatase D